MSALVALPTTSDPSAWSPDERALVEAAGLIHVDSQSGERIPADRPTVAAFLAHCARTGLDPIARQIYCLARKSRGSLKWQIQISIDGARLVAERTKQYEGQTPVQWTADGVTWVDVWLADEPPRAARVGVFRTGFREPLYAVATWDSYVQTKYDGSVTDMWKKFGPLMLGKCAESLALRKAFPQDLSGLYTAEEMSQAEAPAVASKDLHAVHAGAVDEHKVLPGSAPEEDDARDWEAEIAACETYEVLKALYGEAQEVGAFARLIGEGENRMTVESALWARKTELEKEPQQVVDVEPEAENTRDWVAEAKQLKTSIQVVALSREAMAGDAPTPVLEALAEIAADLDTAEKQKPEAGGDWAASEKPAEGDEEADTPAVLVDEPVADAAAESKGKGA